MLAAQQITWEQNGKPILQGIDFHIERGERVGLAGPNGSGKSSLIKILSFLERPTGGQVTFDGQSIGKQTPLELRRKMAVVFQEPLLFRTTVFENVASGLKIRGVPKADIRRRVEQWLELFGISHLQNQAARSLSGGEAQRVSLARAFVLEPDLIFLDEPFSALDAPTKEMLRRDLADVLQIANTAVVLVSHDFRDIERLTKRAVILMNGLTAAEGTPDELLTLPQPEPVDQFLTHWRNKVSTV